MSVHTLVPQRAVRISQPKDLVEALGIAFSEQQLAAVTAPLTPGVIIAGAGSGKTTVMAARVVWLVGTGAVRPEEILGLTFTRKAAAELSHRVRSALVRAGVVSDKGADESGEQVVMTYDAFAARLVSEHGLRLGHEADPTLISGATRYRLASRVVRNAAGPFEFLSRLRPATITERVLKLDADLQQHLVPLEVLDGHAREALVGWRSAPLNNRGNVYVDAKRAMIACQERLELASLVADYQELKRRLGLVEFADQMAIAARLASTLPAVSAALRASFRVVLLDEYQDTSAAQAVMLRGLFSGRTPSTGLGHPVTAVGDPFQAIYGWRGAAASNILTFDSDFRQPDGRRAERFALTVNRRSGQRILDVANVLSRPLRAGRPAAAGSEGVPGPSAGGPAEHGRGNPAPPEQGLLQAPPEAAGGSVRAATFETWPAEVTWIGEQIVGLKEAGDVANWADIAVLSRRNADIAALYGELTGREVPVEIVGLGGLLQLPEIADITAVLRLVDDVSANPELVRLLTGPRWRIGPRDLALLGRRARALAGGWNAAADDPEAGSPAAVLAALGQAVAETDPTEVVSLLDALESPGDLPYSAEAVRRFAELAEELSSFRRHADEPVLDLIRRIVATTGLDVELMATPEFDRSARRDQLGAFTDAVAAYVDVDGDASLSGLLAYLQAEIDAGAGLEQAVPSDREAVKLLTVHKAKGLEWEVVFLPALMKGVFPSDRVTDNWVTNAAVVPADLRGDADSIPQLADTSNSALADYRKALTAQQLLAEDRLAYVAATRAKRLLIGTGHTWRPELVNPRVPSSYLEAIVGAAEREQQLVQLAPPAGRANPMHTATAPAQWPAPLDPESLARRLQAAAAVEAARRPAELAGHTSDPVAVDDLAVVAAWDEDIDRLLSEARSLRSGERAVPLPASLTATALVDLHADPVGYVRRLARPMPRPPSRAASFGTRFHSWVERHYRPTGGPLGQLPLIDPDDPPDHPNRSEGLDPAPGDPDRELRELCAAFADGQYGSVLPTAVEAPFTLVLGPRLIRGRIDAVYGEQAPGMPVGSVAQIVDWKTSRAEIADPWQLAIYRLAWAEAHGLAVEQVDAVFYFVRTDAVVRPGALPGRVELQLLVDGAPRR